MPRNARFTLPHRPTVYHVISRTALPGLPLGDIEKNRLLEIIKYFSSIYFVEVLGFCIMGNHWHLAVKIYPRDYATRQEVQERFVKRYVLPVTDMEPLGGHHNGATEWSG